MTGGEIQSLLLRAMSTVRDLREQAGIPGSSTEYDALVHLDIAAKGAARLSLANISASLREAADMIRTLWIVIDSGPLSVLSPLNELELSEPPRASGNVSRRL